MHHVCSEKLDVEDHYVAWRQTHDQPQHQFGLDGPFSFCSYPFLLNPRAKSKLLHTEARFLMTQVLSCLYQWPLPKMSLSGAHGAVYGGLCACLFAFLELYCGIASIASID